ncbi:MAG: hypothetical protein WBA16_12435 [Nonlabens sp.]
MRNFFLTIFLMLFSIASAFAHDSNATSITQTVINSGVGLGTVLAVVISWERNKSVLLAAIHGIFSWFYVIYFLLTRKDRERR